jgi:hypothetical protein
MQVLCLRASEVRIGSIMRQITVLNCILLVIILAFAYFIIVPIFTVEVSVPAPLSAVVKADEPTKEPAAEQNVNPNPVQDYAVISEKNLFHPDRIIPVEKKGEVIIPRPEFVLYGTLIADNVVIAYLSDKKAPRTTPGRGKRQVGLKIGETLSGYTLKEVLPDRVVLRRGEDTIELKVISPENRKDRDLAEGVASSIPGGRAAQPTMPNPSGQQPLPQLQTMPQVQSGNTGANVQIPTPIPGVRSRRPIGKW